MVEEASDVQSAIQEHLAEQREALTGLDEALVEGSSNELLEMRAQIQEAVNELEKLLKAEAVVGTPCMQAAEGTNPWAKPAAIVGHRSKGEAEEGADLSSGSDTDDGEHKDAVPSRAALAMAADAEAVARAADAGPQTDTVMFAGWEQHTRGVASKLMAAMGYMDGSGLGAAKQGTVAPLKTWVLQRGAGLGHATPTVAGAQPDGQSKKARRGGGSKRRAAQAAKAAREAARDAQNQLEIEAGAPGLFAFINTRLGTGATSSAAPDQGGQQRGAPSGRPVPGGQASGSSSKYFAAQGTGGGSASKRPKQAPPPDRRALALQQDAIVALREKLQRLREMSIRNARDRIVSAQVRRQVEATEKELAAAEAASSHVHRMVHASEKRRSWLTF